MNLEGDGWDGGADGIRTHDLDGANVALSQLSYGPGTNTRPRRKQADEAD
jgi:hypothetical protein